MKGYVSVVEEPFGTITSDPKDDPTKTKTSIPVRKFTLHNKKWGTVLQVMNYGATITSLKVKDRYGNLEDIVLGYDTIEGYLGAFGRNPYFGSTIGRVANRTAKGRFALGREQYQLGINNGENHLHGGLRGFDKRMWECHVPTTSTDSVTFSYLSRDGEEGYPGDVIANVTYKLHEDSNQLEVTMTASVTKPTPVGLTNHSYFNLSGHKTSDKKLQGHSVLLNADHYTPVDGNLIPTGEIKSVEGSIFDFRSTQNLHKLLQQFPDDGPNGFDHNFCLNSQSLLEGGDIRLVATVQETSSGRLMNVYSNQPGVQFYTSNFLPDANKKDEKGIPGKEGALYWKHGAFCLETQNYPDAINHDNFPEIVLLPGEIYKHKVIYQFLTTAN